MEKNGSEKNIAGVIACAVGKGLFCGFAATAIMTLAQQIEMKITGRSGSDTPARAGSKFLGVTPVEEKKNRFNNMVHFFYGTVWGVVQGFLAVFGLTRMAGAFLHFIIMWITGMILLPSLKVSTPPWKWGLKGIATDGFFHVVYAAGAALVYGWLDRRRSVQRG